MWHNVALFEPSMSSLRAEYKPAALYSKNRSILAEDLNTNPGYQCTAYVAPIVAAKSWLLICCTNAGRRLW